MPYSTTTFGTETLNVLSIDKKQVAGTIKQKIGSNLAISSVPGRSTKDWMITIRGLITGVNRDTARTNLINLNDQNPYQFSDGLITINVIIPDGGLEWDDTGDKPSHYTYTLTLIEFNQSL